MPVFYLCPVSTFPFLHNKHQPYSTSLLVTSFVLGLVNIPNFWEPQWGDPYQTLVTHHSLPDVSLSDPQTEKLGVHYFWWVGIQEGCVSHHGVSFIWSTSVLLRRLEHKSSLLYWDVICNTVFYWMFLDFTFDVTICIFCTVASAVFIYVFKWLSPCVQQLQFFHIHFWP